MISFNPEIQVILATVASQLVITIPILFLLIRSWAQRKIDNLNAANDVRHAETAQKLDTVVNSLTTSNGSDSGTR